MDETQLAILVAGGFAAGVINTLAGGGSLITVGLLVFLGLPGTLANGTNRVGVLVQNLTSAWRFRAEGVSGFRGARGALVPVVAGSLIGAYGISQVTPEFFERLFGVVMLALLFPMLRPGATRKRDPTSDSRPPWSPAFRTAVFFAIGLYGGAIQAGIGIFVVFALSRAGYDLVQANSIKVVLIAALTLVAVPVFVISGQVEWPAALALVQHCTGGIPGLINTLCEAALARAQVDDRAEVDRSVIARAARNLHPVAHGGRTFVQGLRSTDAKLLRPEPGARLMLSRGGRLLGDYELNGTRKIIGRHPCNDIRIDCASVSRYHAMLLTEGGRHVLVDLNSSNGTFVNSRSVEQCVLDDADILAIGEYRLKYLNPLASRQDPDRGAQLVHQVDTVVLPEGGPAEPRIKRVK